MNRHVRSSFVFRCLVVASAIAFGGCWCAGCNDTALSAAATSGNNTSDESAVPVSLAKAVREDVPIQVKAIGWAESMASVTIRSQVEGQLVGVHFDEGQQVKAGDLLFSIDRRPFAAALRLAEATLLKDQALALNAEQEYARIEGLFERNMAADRERDQAKANADSTRAQVEADRAAVDDARLRLEYCEIRSPIDGCAGNLLVDPGNIVKENETALVTINQLSPIYVNFSVAERHLPAVRKQLASGPLAVEAAFPNDARTRAEGKLTFIDNEVNTDSGMVLMKAVFQNDDLKFWPGRFVNVAVTLSMLRQAVVVPSPAIQTGQKGSFVFVAGKDNTVEMRSVTVGPNVADQTVIEAGVEVGDAVVTDGQLRLLPGSKVRAVEHSELPSVTAEGVPG
ncbi:MAG: efflux RND transporter periplasmic adaptor subunit [Phycisphaerae bacterium]|nr:efflux RND transporter periplasmic adaptor subunit [Phycisphaerae bacterium]